MPTMRKNFVSGVKRNEKKLTYFPNDVFLASFGSSRVFIHSLSRTRASRGGR